MKRKWPAIRLPTTRGAITAVDVMQAPEGVQRDAAIDAWCQSVWTAFSDSRTVIVGLMHEHGIE